MKLMKRFLFLCSAFFTQDKALGEEQRIFLEKYKDAIQGYTMKGNEKGWKNCDILSADTYLNGKQPQFSVGLDKLKTLDIRSTFTSSSCLLVSYHVGGMQSLENLIDFGWAAIQHIRLALVVKMKSGITLNMISNTTKLPFMIAAELEEGREQFLCPIIGVVKPILEENVCNPSYVSYKEKVLRVTFMGNPPQFILTNAEAGQFDGVDIRLMRILEKYLNFRGEIIMPKSFLDAEIKVCLHVIIIRADNNHNYLCFS